MTREEFRDYVEFLRSQNEISYDVYSTLIDGIDTLEQQPCEDCISRQAAIDALHMHLMYRMGTDSNKKRLDDWINSLPSAQGKPFNLPEIYIADGYDTIEGEDGNVGFGVYVPDENQIYVAGDVEGEIRARALFHEVCHWVQAMCGRPFDEDEANEFSDIVYDALPSAQPNLQQTCNQLATDCISRQAAIDALDTGLWGAEWDKALATAMLKDLPPVQPKPKTGHWIDIMVGDMQAQACDQCKTFYPLAYTGGGHKYCPNCGCRMIVPQESEGKE